MAITSAIVLLAVYWFLTLFVVLPIGLKTQGDAGERLVGTHASSPVTGSLMPKLWWTTGVAIVLWAITCGIILSGIISVDDFDLYQYIAPKDPFGS